MAPPAPLTPVRRPRRGELHDYYFAYVDLVSGDDVLAELERGATATLALLAELGEDRAILELQLAHRRGDSTEQAYDRAEFWEQRVALMARWANWLDEVMA